MTDDELMLFEEMAAARGLGILAQRLILDYNRRGAEIDRLCALNAEMVKWLTAAVFSIKANSEGKPIPLACPWSLAWYQPALDVLAKHAGILPEPKA